MNTYYVGSIPITDELYHYGIKGQKWGIRRYQNPDRSYTQAGKERYGKFYEDKQKAARKDLNEYKRRSDDYRNIIYGYDEKKTYRRRKEFGSSGLR